MLFTVDRELWDRSRKGSSSSGELLTNDGYYLMCCLGFVCMQVGFSEAEILGKCYPYDTIRANPSRVESVNPAIKDFFRQSDIEMYGIFYENSYFSQTAGIINDDPSTTDSEKEEQLTKLFAYHSHEIVFIN